ncbi:hypothetical protein BDR04DRAFT_1128620 [Suillus decipiens]|nr:hypothetical protein BDR04DRAFT_1128620 [Suillus decipiens]
MIHLEGHGNDIMQGECNCKGKGKLLYHCCDCFGVEMMCHMCMLNKHTHNPLHRIEISLKSLGLHVQLRHNPGEKCYNPEPTTGDDFVIVDLRFCGCETVQFFHLLSFESKVSAYEFYHSILFQDCYSVFMHMVHEWCHLKQLKYAGRGHDPHGVDATSAGACAVLCPACPQPSKNLPDNWENAPLESSWIYALFLAIDANFQLKQKLVSGDNVNLSLNAGWSYFVEDVAYKQYLSEHGCEPQEKSTCISHNAVNMANTKTSRRLAATGVGTVDCTRHDMKLPNGVDDLQKVFLAILSFSVFIFNLSYDVACQWHKKLWTHRDLIPPHLHLTHENKIIQFFVPKFHLNAHIQQCQTSFSFNFSKNVGCMDVEAPERGWTNINHVALSTKEMGPGACSKVHQEELHKLEHTIPVLALSAWRSEMIAWEEDHTKPNPFKSRIADIQHQLAEKDAADLQASADVSLHTEISPSILIASGIDLQDQQQCLAMDASAVLYMPAIASIHSAEEARQSEHTIALKPEEFKLWLPSELDPHLPCHQKLHDCEWELWYPQAHNALNDTANIQGQHASTCACTALDLVAEKMCTGKAKYDAAWTPLVALTLLLGKTGWSDILCPLLVSDMRPMGDLIQGQSKGTCSIPWIVLQDNDEGLQDSHWCKELMLLLEEMWRVLAFLTWQVEWWLGLSSAHHFKRLADTEGSAAYAKCQSSLWESMLEKFK